VLGNFRDFEADLLLAVDEIPRVENYYESVYQTNEHVLVVDVDRGGKILKIDSLVIDASFTMFLTSIAGMPGIVDRFKYQVILARIYLKLHACLKTCFFQPCAS